MASACVLLANGFEEIEAVTIVDVLRRARIELRTLGVGGVMVRGAHGITILADRPLASVATWDWDALILPGGMPAAAILRDDRGTQLMIRRQHRLGRLLAAICAGPVALAQAGVLEGRKATCYPGYQDQLDGALYVEQDVVDAGQVITSRGPGTALAFSLALVARLEGEPAARQIEEQLLLAA